MYLKSGLQAVLASVIVWITFFLMTGPTALSLYEGQRSQTTALSDFFLKSIYIEVIF